MLICQRRFADCSEFGVPAHAPGRWVIISNNVLLLIADITLKWVANYIYIPVYSTISRIPTSLRYSPLLPVSKNGRDEILTTDQTDVAFRLNPAEVSNFCKSALAYSPAPLQSRYILFTFWHCMPFTDCSQRYNQHGNGIHIVFSKCAHFCDT